MRSPDGKVHVNIYLRVQINSLFDGRDKVALVNPFLWSLLLLASVWGLSVHAVINPLSWRRLFAAD